MSSSVKLFSYLQRVLLLYKSPLALTYAWGFGSMALLFLMLQIITGLVLAFYYIPSMNEAFWSIDHIMRDVKYGWLISYMHANGASFFFFALYAHIFSTLFFASFIGKHSTWGSGIIMFMLVMLTAFFGYVLPWGQMSYWAATVITSLVSVVPLGEELLKYILGGFAVGQAALGRIFALHFVLPFVMLMMVGVHLFLLHEEGSSDNLGDSHQNDDVSFHPLFSIKDILGYVFIIMMFVMMVCFYPQSLGHPINYQEADPEVTPAHIVPEWYFLVYYGMLRAIPHKGLGIAMTGVSVLLFFSIPWLVNETLVRNGSFSMLYMCWVMMLITILMLVGWFGACMPETPFIEVSLSLTVLYLILVTFGILLIVFLERFLV